MSRDIVTKTDNTQTKSTGFNAAEDTLRWIRRLLLVLFVLGALGTIAELLLIGHFEEFWQWLPIALLGISLGGLGWQAAGGGKRSIYLFRLVMILSIISGGIGLYQHYVANAEFELEMYPSMAGLPLFWKAIQGKSPPSLAPAWMIELGLLGLLYTLRHPNLYKGRRMPGEKR